MNCKCTGSGSDLSLLDELLEKYASVRGSLITILQGAQQIYGYLPVDVIYHIAERTGNTPARVMGVATFYTQFRLTPMGRHLIMLCKGTACHVNGADRVAAAIEEALGITDGETTEDGMFSLKYVACLGCCSLSPVMMIDDDTYGTLTPAKACAILDDIRGKESAHE